MKGQPIDGICPAHGEPEPCQPCANLVTSDDDAIELIEMQSRPPVIGPGEHVHLCPECYGYETCAFACSCPADLTLEDGTHCGSPAACDGCAPRVIASEFRSFPWR